MLTLSFHHVEKVEVNIVLPPSAGGLGGTLCFRHLEKVTAGIDCRLQKTKKSPFQ